MKTTEEMDIEIDILSLIYRVLKHWRLLIVSMIIGGILMNEFGYLKSKKDAANVQETIEDYQDKIKSGTYDENGNTIMSIPDFEKNLTERQINEVNNLVSTYKMYQGPYSNTVEYINNSILMQIDPKAAPTYTLLYAIDTHYLVEYPEINKQDYSPDILNSIWNSIITEKNLNEIADSLSSENETINPTYIQELINYTITNNTFLITIHGRTKEECETISNILKDKMPGIFKRLKVQFADFDYTLISESYYEAYDRIIQTSQQSRADELNNIYKTTQGMIQNLTDDQKAYFYALLNNENTVLVELPVESNSTEEDIDPSTLEVPAVHKFNMKYSILGLLLGLFAASAIIICNTLWNGKMICNRDIESYWGISPLGVWRITSVPKSIFSWFDRLLIKIFDKRDEYNKPEDEINRIITDITLSSNKNNWNTLYIATTTKKKDVLEAITNMSDMLKTNNLTIHYGNTLFYDSGSLENLTSSDAVVIVEHTGYSKICDIKAEYNLCNRYQKPIVGYVTLK